MRKLNEQEQERLLATSAASSYAAVTTSPVLSEEISTLFQYLNQAAALQENQSGLAEKFQTFYRLFVHRFFQAALPPLLIAFLQTNFPTLLAFIPDISVELAATGVGLGVCNVGIGVADHHYESKTGKVIDDFIKDQNKLKQLMRDHADAMHKLLEFDSVELTPEENGVTALQAVSAGQSIISQKAFEQLSQHKHPWLKRTRQVMDIVFGGINGVVTTMFAMLFVNGYLEKEPPEKGYDTKAWFQILAGSFSALLATTGALAAASDTFVEKHRRDAAFLVISEENNYIQTLQKENRVLIERVKQKFDIEDRLGSDASSRRVPSSSFASDETLIEDEEEDVVSQAADQRASIVEGMREDAKVISRELCRRRFFNTQESTAGASSQGYSF